MEIEDLGIEDLMQLIVDLSLIGDGELEALAVKFGRYEDEFQEDHEALRDTFQSLQDVLRSETIARKAGINTGGLQRFYLFPRQVFESAELFTLAKIAGRIANGQGTSAAFGDSLLMALMV